ncbi:FxSxx-COOH system tetratricopeptide repeat protein [Geodermatophilus sp. SYSU D00696]
MTEATDGSGGVFVSWTRRDEQEGTDRLAEMRQLVELLEESGVPVWIDDAGIEPFDSIPDRVRSGLAGAKVLLAWYSQAYPTRRPCREELTLALLAAERAGQGPGRVLVVNPEPGLDHIIEPRLLESRFATADDLADLPALATRIAQKVAAQPSPFGALPVRGQPRWLYGAAGWKDGSRRFVGRLGQLWTIHDRLHRDTDLVGDEPGRGVALVSGFGGMGKSLLAAEYAHLFADLYPGGVVWLSAAGNDATGGSPSPEQARADAEAQYIELATTLGLSVANLEPTLVRHLVAAELDRRGDPVLWIADDVPTGLDSAGLGAWRCSATVVHEILTTRDTAQGYLPRAVDLDVLSPADALALLTQGRAVPEDEREQAGLLAEDLGHHPLACDVAGLYIAGTGSTVTAYRARLRADLGRFDQLAARLADQLPGGHARQITTTLATSLDRLGDDAWTLLRLAGQLAPTAIPRQLIADVFARRAPSDDEPDSTDIDVEDAVDGALLDPHRDGLYSVDPATQTVLVHVLVRAAATLLDPHPDHQAPIRAAAVAALLDQFDDAATDVRRHPALTDLAAHVRHLTAGPDALGDEGSVDLLGWLAGYDHEAGRPALAAQEWERTLADYERMLGPDHPTTLTNRGNLANSYRAAGRLAEALPLLERTLADCERMLGTNHPNTLTSRNNLAEGYRDTGRLDQALPLLERTLADSERILGPNHPDTLTSRNNLALAYRAAGRLDQALPLLEGTLADCERILGPDHPTTLTSRGNLAEGYRDAGRLDQALPLLERTLADSERILGSDHPDTLTSRNNLATACHGAGRLNEALPLYERTLADQEGLLGPDHPNTLASRNNLAEGYRAAGRLDQALPLHERTVADCERLLGPDHPNTLTSRNNLAAAHHAAGRPAEALPLLERTLADHERVLGPEHRQLAVVLHGLGQVRAALGDLPGAAATLARAVRIDTAAYGPDHPEVATDLDALAAVQERQGDVAAAEATRREAARIRHAHPEQ